MLNALVLLSVVATVLVLMSPRVAHNQMWHATITPLASIIGSGFLVLGPILHVNFGGYAPLAMAALCVMGWGFGSAIRFNISARARRLDGGQRWFDRQEYVASLSLAFAYVISVAYYLNLLGAFGVSLTDVNDQFHARVLTSAVFLFILIEGWRRGFNALEHLEQISVTLKLAIIAGLLVGLALYFGERGQAGALAFRPPEMTGLPALAMLAGLIVTVQGFETSRYLGNGYDAATRQRSMRLAQIIATGIYMIYIGLLSYSMKIGDIPLTETAIIDLMDVVAPVLPLLLVAAALSAQLSAAVADTGGSGGLFEELSRQRFRERHGYVFVVAVGLVLTWTSNLFEIIAYASRAFAVYYSLQSAIAARAAWQEGHHVQAAAYWVFCLIGAGIAIFGVPVE